MNRLSAFLLIISCILINSCGGSSSGTLQTRPFYMGFTPWPYDFTIAAVDDTYTKINENGDLVAHHLDGGIPWDEALSGSAYHVNVESEFSTRVTKTQANKVVYLAVNPLNSDRDGLADHWGASTGEALTPPWSSYSFADQDVIDAYIAFSLDLIARFNPTYFNYAIEINELMVNDINNGTTEFDAFVTFSNQVYSALKLAHPELPLMVSIALKTPGSAEMLTAQAGFDRIKDNVDLVGVSSYGYIFYSHADKGDPANLPSDWLSQIKTIAPGKPVAIAETGWIAEDLDLSSPPVLVTSNETWQNNYLTKLFTEAEAIDAEFIVWFSIVDFDALWSGALGSSDVAKIWRDTGLYDDNVQARAGLTTWKNWYARQKN
jgi:hypothetical protein